MNGLAYISGPVSNMPDRNVPAFEKAKDWLEYFDFIHIDPHEVSPYHPDKEWRHYMADDLFALARDADYIYFLPGWWHSRGAWLELIVALFCKIKILNFSLPRRDLDADSSNI